MSFVQQHFRVLTLVQVQVYYTVLRTFPPRTCMYIYVCMYVVVFGRDFVDETLGSKYTIGRYLDFAISYEESGPATPVFFILSPGVDPLKDVEKQGKQMMHPNGQQHYFIIVYLLCLYLGMKLLTLLLFPYGKT